MSTEVHEKILVITPHHYLAEICGSTHTDIAHSQEKEWMHLKSTLNAAAQMNNNKLTFYTDNSLARNSDNPFHPINPIMDSAWHNTETSLSGKHRIEGYALSTNPEAKAVLLALEACPPDTDIHIHTDFQLTHNITAKIASGQYWDIPISHVLKMGCWFTWEAIARITKSKHIHLTPHKVAAHSGDFNNDQADLAAMKAREQQVTTYFCNSDSSRIAFALAHRRGLVEENPRKFLKHLTQNVCRAN